MVKCLGRKDVTHVQDAAQVQALTLREAEQVLDAQPLTTQRQAAVS